MPPSLRIRQKCTERKSTRTNGRAKTWSTYQRSNVSGPTAHPPAHPVELARRVVGAGVEHARHVQRHGQDHQVSTPPVQVADEVAEEHRGADVLHVRVSGGPPHPGG